MIWILMNGRSDQELVVLRDRYESLGFEGIVKSRIDSQAFN